MKVLSKKVNVSLLPTLTLPGSWAFKGGIARNALIERESKVLDIDILGDEETQRFLDEAEGLPPIDFELADNNYFESRDLTINEVLLSPEGVLKYTQRAEESFLSKTVRCAQKKPSGREIWRGRLLALRLGWDFEERWEGVNLPQTMHLMPALLCKAEEDGVLLKFLERYLRDKEEATWKGFPKYFLGLEEEKHPIIWGKVRGGDSPPSAPRWDPELGCMVTDL